MQRLAFCLLFLPILCAQNAKDIIRRSMERDSVNWEQRKNYTYVQRIETRRYDGNHRLIATASESKEILVLDGRRYDRLMARDDQPLSPKEARRERDRMDAELARRRRESAADKSRLEKERIEERKFLLELPEAYNLRLTGAERIGDEPAWVIQAEPKPGYRPANPRASVLAKVRARIWINQATYEWVKADVDAVDTISFRFGLFRIAPGGHLTFEQTRVNGEVWLPEHITVRADARLALIKTVHGEIDITYRDYKKFQANSRIVEDGEKY